MKKRTSTRPAARKDPPAFAPVPRKCKRHDGWTPARQKAFIDALSDMGSVRAAAASVGMTSESAYYLRRQPGAEEFAAAWEAALAHCMEILRDGALDRAIHGIEVPVMSYGKKIGTRRIYNERLVTFMLRNYDGRMSAGVTDIPLHLRQRMNREVERALALARIDWEKERDGIDEDEIEREKTSQWLDIIEEQLRESEAREEEEERERERVEAELQEAEEAMRAVFLLSPPGFNPWPEGEDGDEDDRGRHDDYDGHRRQMN